MLHLARSLQDPSAHRNANYAVPGATRKGVLLTMRLLSQVVLEFLGRPDVSKRNEDIANAGESKSGGWSIGQLLQKPKGSTSRTKSQMSYGVVVEVVLVGEQDNVGSAAYPWPWVLWEGDDEVSSHTTC